MKRSKFTETHFQVVLILVPLQKLTGKKFTGLQAKLL